MQNILKGLLKKFFFKETLWLLKIIDQIKDDDSDKKMNVKEKEDEDKINKKKWFKLKINISFNFIHRIPLLPNF